MEKRWDNDQTLIVNSEGELRKLFGKTHDLAQKKVQTELDHYAQELIARSPFLCLGTQNISGKADVSPRGDAAGFVKILDSRTIALPDRPGNNRLDSLNNIISNAAVGLIFIIPGFDDTLRVNGRAKLVTDADLLAQMSVNGKVPKIAVVVEIDTVFLHCAKAFRRSKLWDEKQHQDRQDMPSLVKMILDQTGDAPRGHDEQKKLDDELEQDYRSTMY
ncbi:pyridoxamine 5'-phosphate oxidase family protein [Maritalea porphyrae]|uniref:Pyridoxamine 5'-phosphate oxidase N-terminal domain-containing protein n=1 Tax=Maritalea porphyrae TaxID=880732 RepID=A0ABQ5UNW3_9HYPH|nr:pyridoxamine 5'-phosphate oxidase family protein [Maritalea porphyrae]GLQ16026.1 hypothetical protein GCM10007879_02750 [Maritalea porphyrae]